MPKRKSDLSDGEVVSFFGKHLVALDVTFEPFEGEDSPSTPEQRVFYSGTLIRIHGILFLVTAGHALERIRVATASGLKIKRTRIHDTFGKETTSRVPIPFALDPDKLCFIHDDAAGLDFGVIHISPSFERLLAKNGVIALEEENWKHQQNVCFDKYAMLGLPEEFCVFRRDGAATVSPTLLPISEHESPPQRLLNSKHKRFFGRFGNLKDVTSLVGMSGGPIFGFRREPQFQYWVIAIQSGCSKPNNLIFATRIPIIADLLTTAFDEAAA